MSIMVQNRPSSHRSPFSLITFAMRSVALCYGATAYFVFLGTFLYAVGFVSQYIVPKTINTGAVSPLAKALLVDLLLMSIFAVQHSGMTRQGFKKLFAQIASPVIERSSYVLLASLTLLLLFWQWQPIPTEVWNIDTPVLVDAQLHPGHFFQQVT